MRARCLRNRQEAGEDRRVVNRRRVSDDRAVGSAVTADFGRSTLVTGTATTRAPGGSNADRDRRTPSASVRPPRPTKTVSPTLSTSPPSSVPGARSRSTDSPSAVTASSAPAASARRDTAPDRAGGATSRKTTTVSSTNTASGPSAVAGTSSVCRPWACSPATYPSPRRAASLASTGARSRHVTSPSARRGAGERTSAFLLGTGRHLPGGGGRRPPRLPPPGRGARGGGAIASAA